MWQRASSGSGGGASGGFISEVFTPSTSTPYTVDLSTLGITPTAVIVWYRQNNNSLQVLRLDVSSGDIHYHRDDKWNVVDNDFQVDLYISNNTVYYKAHNSTFVYPTFLAIV